MKIIIQIEVIGADPSVLIEATRVSLGCDELQAGIVSVAENAGHGNVQVLSAEVVASEQMIGGLRDQFALGAMQGLLSFPHHESFQFAPYAHTKPESVAADAYAIADAMLAARERKTAPR